MTLIEAAERLLVGVWARYDSQEPTSIDPHAYVLGARSGLMQAAFAAEEYDQAIDLMDLFQDAEEQVRARMYHGEPDDTWRTFAC